MDEEDLGAQISEEELKKLERQIIKASGSALVQLRRKINAYFESFAKRDAEIQEMLEADEIALPAGVTAAEYYKQWRLNNIGRGETLEKMAEQCAERIAKATETAMGYVSDEAFKVYLENLNRTAYQIEQHGISGVKMPMINEDTLRRLIKDHPDLMPHYPVIKAISRGFNLAWGKSQITQTVTSGILQGASNTSIAAQLIDRVWSMSTTSAIRAARTACTAAQNGGKQDTIERLEKEYGIKTQKEWMSGFDERTRPEHALADGQVVDSDQPFIVGGEPLMYPGDPSGSGWNVYNCRCVMRTVIPEYPYDKRETYEEWLSRKMEEQKDTDVYQKLSEKYEAEKIWESIE